MILDELVTLLAADSDVNDLIAGRIFTVRAPDNVTLPYVTMSVLVEGRIVSLGSTATNNPARVQIDCWSDDQSEALDLSDKIETAMFGASTFKVADYSRTTDIDNTTLTRRVIIDSSLWT
jgi:hypothetical protein